MPMHPSLGHLEIRRANAARLRRVAGKILGINPRDRSTCLIVSRSSSLRALQNVADVLDYARRRLPHLRLELFNDEDDFATGIRKFMEARVIIGAHGAGLANAIFSSPGTVIIEISFSYENLGVHVSANTAIWRTNGPPIVGANPGLKWQVYAVDVPVQETLLAANRSVSEKSIKTHLKGEI